VNRSRLGDLLLRHQRISREKLDVLVREAALQGDTLTAQLVRQNIFTEPELVAFLAKSYGCPVIDLEQVKVDGNMTSIPVNVLT